MDRSRRRALLAASVLCAGAAACRTTTVETAPVIEARGPLVALPVTRAERSGYRETSSYADVVGFLRALQASLPSVVLGTMGRTTEERDLPFVVLSRPVVRTAAEARATGKPIVFVQGNIHAGEVEGKEALQALVRDLAASTLPNVLDSIVLVAVPIYNADGNERWGPQEKQRSEQNGPELVGQRANARDLDLNRDYVKAEAPETRASLAMFAAWDPDVFVDLHTTDGSFHGYALTYSPSLNPAAPLGEYSRELLAELRRRVRERDSLETFDYGNFSDAFGREVGTDTVHSGWYTYDHRPRFGTNYYGLRGKIAVLSEAYSHDPFEQRVRSTYAFTRELLSLVAERREAIVQRTRSAPVFAGSAASIPVRAALPATAPAAPVRFDVLARTGDSARTEAGVPRGLRRTGEYRTRDMPVFDRFVPTHMVPVALTYLLTDTTAAITTLLRAHGLVVRPMERLPDRAIVEEFQVDSVVRSTRVFQGHREVRLVGRWRAVAAPPSSALQISGTRALAAWLLEPESDDGLATWNLFDHAIRVGDRFPVLRVRLP